MKEVSIKVNQNILCILWISAQLTPEKELGIPKDDKSFHFTPFIPQLFLKSSEVENKQEVIIFDMTLAYGYSLKNLRQIISHFKHQVLIVIIEPAQMDLGITVVKEGVDDFLLSTEKNITSIKYKIALAKLRRKKEKEASQKTRQLSIQSAKMKEQFLASVSHEMRTPLNAILGMSNLILATDLSEEQYSYLHPIKHSSEILLGVVNDILQVSEIQNQKLKFDNKSFDLYELLYNLINVMQYKVKKEELSIELIIAEDIPKIIKGDKLRLNQILYNLVGNALKFTDKGAVKIFVINCNQSEYSIQLEFRIEDTGIGIAKEKQAEIFKSFSKIRNKERVFEGTGLGLSIAKNLVELQGGKIGLNSQIGQGTTFFFDLIFEIDNVIEKKIPSTFSKTVDTTIDFRLLLVEDNKLNQIVAQKTLEKQWENIKITIANNGEEAVSILKNQYFDIILMDIQMPKMNGFETTNYIRQRFSPPKADIPILAMTAHAHIFKDEQFKRSGMNDYILKPFNPQRFFEKIVQYCQSCSIV